MKRKSAIFLAATSLGASVAFPAFAQVQEPRGDQLEEIIVTAQKRSEPLQRTPISVTALSASALEDRSISSLDDLQGSVPGLVIGGNANFGGINSIVFRGISSPNLVIGAEEAVGVYLDGVFLPRSDAAFFNFADVERIEALRGPQGTLYGRNSTAGAINVITRTPTDKLEGKFEANYGVRDKYEVKGYLGGPISSILAASASVVASGHGGYFINVNTGNKVGSADDITTRGKLMLRTDNFRATLAADYSLMKSDDQFKNIKNAAGTAVIGFGNPDEVATEVEDQIYSDRKSYGVSLSMEYDVNDELTMTSISSERWYRADNFVDTDGQGSTTVIAYTDSHLKNKDLSQELRANYASGPLNLTAGLNYYNGYAELYATNLNAAGPTVIINPIARTKAYAAFAQGEYELSEGLKFILGARYNVDKKKFSLFMPALGAAGESYVDARRNDKAFLPKFGLTYQASPDVFMFATVSRGYRAGAFSPAPGRFNPVAPGAAPEKLWNYEAGIKSELFDRRLRLNVTGYYTKDTGLQVRNTLAPGNAVINNAGSARVYGAEVEASLVLGGGFSVDGTLALTNARYIDLVEKNFLNGQLVSFPRAGNDMIRAPHYQFSINGRYETAVTDDARVKATIHYYKEAKSFYTAANEFGVGNDGWYTLDARIGVTYRDNLEIYAYGKNLTDKRYTTSVLTLGAIYSSALNDPRTYGVGVKYSF